MKVLLDENLPIKLKNSITSTHEVYTVHEMNWSGTKNGELLDLMASNNFEVFITGDKNIKFQQNLSSYQLTIIILHTNSLVLDNLISLMPDVNRIIRKKSGFGLIELKA